MRPSSVSLSWVVSLNLKGVIRSSKSNRMFVTCVQTCSCKRDFLFGNKIYAWNDLRSYMPPTWRFTNVFERTKRTRRKYNCRNQADEEAHYQYIKEDLLDDSNTYISSLDKTLTTSFRVMFFLLQNSFFSEGSANTSICESIGKGHKVIYERNMRQWQSRRRMQTVQSVASLSSL